MHRRAVRGVGIGCLASLLALGSLPAAAVGVDDPYQRVSLALAQGLVALFPAAEGYVVSVSGAEAYVDLAEKDLMRPGMELQLYRPGAEMVHPVSRQVLGTYETELGSLRLTEVREKYSRGVIEAVAGVVVAAGDHARVSARRLRALLAVAGAASGVETGPLALALLGRGAESGRFAMIDEPVWAAALAGLGATPQAIAADPAALRRLGAAAGADLLLLASVESGVRPVVAIDVRSLRTGASLGVLREAWPQPGGPQPASAAPGPGPSAAPATPDASAGAAGNAPASPSPAEGSYVVRDLPGGGRWL
ncbi:MAG TPA: hypothetical protein VN317_09315, partial [Candidatus Methanoperedens sp.]|nr:hypothetical protein [Candidatus Methanoperedens sp.]